jgi:RNA polymerase sigma factor (sigma-70 family)
VTTDATARPADPESARRAVAAVWRIESARIVATLTRMVGDFALAEDLAQDALAEALAQWPASGIPSNPGAWLTAVGKRRAIDGWRRRERYDDRLAAIAHDLEREQAEAADATGDLPYDPDAIDDDVLRLVFVSCHPVLSREARVALTLRVVGGLTTEEIARAFLVPVSTVQQRIVRAKKTLGDAGVPFEVPPRSEFPAGLVPREPEVHGLVALMELTAARFPARLDAHGDPVLLADQDRRRWDRSAITRGRAALARADAIGRGRGAYALQAAIAEQHDVAPSVDDTDWPTIVALYEALGQVAPSPVVELNRAVAVAMAEGAEAGLAIVDGLAAEGRLANYHPLQAVRAELLERLGRADDAREAFAEAARLTANERERAVLLARASRPSPR